MTRRDWMAEFRGNLLDGILRFWLDYGIDRQYGGAMGWLGRQGRPAGPGTKSVAQQGRLLWALCQIYRRYPTPACADAAAWVLDFLRRKMRDPEHSGYYWLVDREGNLLDGMKLLNPMAYVLEALAAYGQAFCDDGALEEALDLFRLMDRHAHDGAHSGYRVAFTQNWQPILEYRSGPRVSVTACVAPVDDVHPVLADSHGRKSSDWHLGLLEAFATLYDVTGDRAAAERLEELLEIFAARVVDPRQGYCRLYFNEKWEPEDWNGDALRCLYGLDMEASWLMTDAAQLLGRPQDPLVRRAALSLVDHALRDGFDHENGGLYLEGPAAGPADCRRKEWWQQAEALVGTLNAWQLAGDARYREAFERQSAYVLDVFTDHEYGDWFAAIEPDGTIDATKAGPWRGPYHATRACLEVMRRLGGTL
ncbi:MAG TPA: AGE family epimerase/isomerase [Bryobacteraceae bacterium]|nr:AGE family epimerase/isomerase [Bryobacteraceae bacterium]